ncbi:alpha/beta hydrolase [Poriferisphaera sp. WC338]|uniref:alpha/beta hydrolase n=1 Tax=Poriferisphaera sp. WC338 TaxID=3425129 RepID=UPI003D81B514
MEQVVEASRNGAAVEADEQLKPRKIKVKRMLKILFVVVLVWCGVVLGVQRRVLWPRWMMGEVGPGLSERNQAGVEVLQLETDQGMVEAWLKLGEGVSAAQPGGLVIFAHGNGELIDDWLWGLDEYVERGISVLLVEFRGYGRSEGSPSEARIVEDFVKFYDLVTARDDVDEAKVIVHGRSIGGGVAMGLVKERGAAGVVLQSVFVSAKRVARGYWVPGFLVLDPLEVEGVLREYDGPVLIMHGADDGVIPPWHAKRNFRAAGDRGELVYFVGQGHNEELEREKYWAAIDRLLERVGVLDEGGSTQ